MIVDESVLSRGTNAYDVIIVGAGAAGLTLAQALGDRRRVLVLEAGSGKETRQGREDYKGGLADTPFKHPPLDTYRVRALGGTTRIWGGRCIPYDRIDFEPRAWVKHSGWPIPYEKVARYYPAAMAISEAGAFEDDPATVLPGEGAELVPGLDGPVVRTTLERFSRPTNFWTRFGDVLRRSHAVHVLPDATVTNIELAANGRRVDFLEMTTRAGLRQRMSAPTVVLAGGGLEVTRLLLSSVSIKPNGIGNDGDMLGRHYMSHLCATAAVASFQPSRGRVMSDYARDAEGIYVRRRLCLSEAAQREHRLQNITFRTHLPDPGDPVHGDGILSAMFLAKSFVQREYAAKFSENSVAVSSYAFHVVNVLRHPTSLARFGHGWLRDRILADRKLPSVVLRSPQNRYPLEFHAEQAPNPLSRVTLGQARDRFGMPRLHVDWQPTAADIKSVQRAHGVLARALAKTGTGSLDYDVDVVADRIRRVGIVGGHHAGLTRMANDDRTGVVDEHCRVHGTENLYVASASVLPTSGQANPTLTVLALALRLADRLTSTDVQFAATQAA